MYALILLYALPYSPVNSHLNYESSSIVSRSTRCFTIPLSVLQDIWKAINLTTVRFHFQGL